MNKLEILKCIEVTSQKQADNGTICYYDPKTNVDYVLYENGYVRRSFPRASRSNGTLSHNHTIYQLNPTRTQVWPTFKYKVRIMLETHQERMDLAARSVINYRKTVKKNNIYKKE